MFHIKWVVNFTLSNLSLIPSMAWFILSISPCFSFKLDCFCSICLLRIFMNRCFCCKPPIETSPLAANFSKSSISCCNSFSFWVKLKLFYFTLKKLTKKAFTLFVNSLTICCKADCCNPSIWPTALAVNRFFKIYKKKHI